MIETPHRPRSRRARRLAAILHPKEGRADAETHLAWMAGWFALNPDVYADDAEGRRAVEQDLMRSCDPKVDGMWAREIAGKIGEVLGWKERP